MSRPRSRAAATSVVALLVHAGCATATHELRVDSDVEGARARVATWSGGRRLAVSEPRPVPAEFRVRTSDPRKTRSTAGGLAIGGGVLLATGLTVGAVGLSQGWDGIGAAGAGGIIGATGLVVLIVAAVTAASAGVEITAVDVHVGAPGHELRTRRIPVARLGSPRYRTIRLNPRPSGDGASVAPAVDLERLLVVPGAGTSTVTSASLEDRDAGEEDAF